MSRGCEEHYFLFTSWLTGAFNNYRFKCVRGTFVVAVQIIRFNDFIGFTGLKGFMGFTI